MNLKAKGMFDPSDALKQPRRELRKLDDYMELFIIGAIEFPEMLREPRKIYSTSIVIHAAPISLDRRDGM